ncbi:MAG: hypothetical protein J6J38_07275 [Lachnospiraceae bacterium]|nr:hypothetical protein [Lachnospiraceae bacterium]
MKKAKLVLANFDARIPNISLRPKNLSTKVTISCKMYDASLKDDKLVKIVFSGVAAVDFRVNYFDNMIGAEVMGLYQIEDRAFVEKLVKDIFERRKEIYLLEGHYDYDENEPADLLNVLDLYGDFTKDMDSYSAYVQNVDAGVYIIVAKEMQVIG